MHEKIEQDQILLNNIELTRKLNTRKGRGKTGVCHNREYTPKYSVPVGIEREIVCESLFKAAYGVTNSKIESLIFKKKVNPNTSPPKD